MTVCFRSYACRACRTEQTVRDAPLVPTCPSCQQPMRFFHARWTKTELLGWSTGMKAPALDFNQTRERIVPIGDGIRVDSLHDMRRLEKESEQRARNGEGEQYIFRKYAQDRQNLHTHTMGEAPYKTPSPEWLRRHAVDSVKDYAGMAPEDVPVEMGPGAKEELASALPE